MKTVDLNVLNDRRQTDRLPWHPPVRREGEKRERPLTPREETLLQRIDEHISNIRRSNR